ncbi:hypothetical protein E4U35_005883 [Claviceps purpurea]|nr:hypothetical protein E4U35_005883 [Claviceps purpurea]
MDPKHWYRTIEENPVANGLDKFHSIARRNQVCDIAAVDRILTKDVRYLAIELVICLQSHPAAKVLQGIHGSVLDDLTSLFDAVLTDSIEDDYVRRLLKAAITKVDDKTLWDEVLAFITASLTAIDTATRPLAPRSTEPQDKSATAAQISTPTHPNHHPSTPQTT